MKKKGFTLIELLAVIVILAVIALIATPAVLGIIEDSKKSAAEASARNIASAAKTHYMQNIMDNKENTNVDLSTNTLKYDGEQATKGYLTYDAKGNVTGKMYISGYCIEIKNDGSITSNKTKESDCMTETGDKESPKLSAVITNTGSKNYKIVVTSLDENEIKELRYFINGELVYKGTNKVYSGTTNEISNTYKIEREDIYGNIAVINGTFDISTCFVAGTKVLTEHGLRNIEDIKIADKVYTINLETNEKELNKVIDTMVSKNSKLYKITLNNNEIITSTEKHQYYVLDKGWVRAYDLKVGDILSANINGKIGIKNIEVLSLTSPVTVYNLTIENNHNYLITENEILVHNSNSKTSELAVINNSAIGHSISYTFAEYNELTEEMLNKIYNFNNATYDLAELVSSTGTEQSDSETQTLKNFVSNAYAVTQVFNLTTSSCDDRNEDGEHVIEISFPALNREFKISILNFNLNSQSWEIITPTKVDFQNKTISYEVSDPSVTVIISK